MKAANAQVKTQVIRAGQIPPTPIRRTTRWHFELQAALALMSGQVLALRGIGYIAYSQIKAIVKYRKSPLRVQKRGDDVYLERLEG